MVSLRQRRGPTPSGPCAPSSISPRTTRSFAPGRTGVLLRLGPAEYVWRANEEMVVYALFEDVAGVDEVEAICRVPGIDGVAVGADDLAASWATRASRGGRTSRRASSASSRRAGGTACGSGRCPGTGPTSGHQIARGCQLTRVAILEWGIQATGDAVAELSALALPAGATSDPPPPDLRAGNGELSHGPGDQGPARRLAV